MDPSVLTTYEASRYLGISPGTLTNWRSQGKGPPYCRIGTCIRYREEDLREWVAQSRVEAGHG